MLRLDKLFFDALTSDESFMQAVGGRVKSTCFEVSPDEKDNTQLPYVIVIDEGKQPAQTTKDDEWMPSEWRVGAGIEVGAKSQNEVDALTMQAMQVVARYIRSLADNGEEIPYLNEGFPQTEGISWDWTKPCYFDVAHYQCDVYNTPDDE